MKKLTDYLALLRLTHWSKAIFVMLGFIYTPLPGYFIPACWATLAFCLIASAVYIYNDIQDRSEDSLHPHKCRRPLASETVTVNDAIFLLFGLLLCGLFLGWLVSTKLAFILLLYLLLNLGYNHLFKLIPILDVLSIATGFMLRVLAGTVGIGMTLSGWLLVAATLLSLFIALNKRRLEMQLRLTQATRSALNKYHRQLLDRLILISGAATFLVYFFYIVYARDQSSYFILTLPFAAIALWRFAWLSTQDRDNDDPVTVFLYDSLSRFNLWCFAILTFMALQQ